jgi:hypothetical protein
MSWTRQYYNNRRTIWRTIAVTSGILAAFVTYFLNIFGVQLLRSYISYSPLQSKSNYPLVAGWDSIFFIFLYAYPVAVGACFLYGFWQGPPSEWKRTAIYLVVFSVIGPLTFINYTQADQLLRVDIQVLFNLFTIFVGYLVVRRVLVINPISYDAAALQSVTILLVSAGFIVMPLFYSAVFAMVFFGWIDHKDAQAIGDKTALGVSGVAGVIAGLLNLRSSIKPS